MHHIIAILITLTACIGIHAVGLDNAHLFDNWKEGLGVIQEANAFLKKTLLDINIPDRSNLITKFVKLKKKAALLSFCDATAERRAASISNLQLIVDQYVALIEEIPEMSS